MKFRIIFVCFTSFILLLSACSNNDAEVIKFQKENSTDTLIVQRVVNNTSSKEKTVKDKQKIQEVLKLIEGLKVKKADKDKALSKMKSQETYMFGFVESDKIDTAKPIPYEFDVLKDGTFIFSSDDFNSKSNIRITTEKHTDLLKKIKTLLDINF